MRPARDDEIAAWRTDGWVLLDGLVGTDEIDEAAEDLPEIFPTSEQFHADPEGEMQRWLGTPPPSREIYTWPPSGPGFRPEQHRFSTRFPFKGSGALNRLCVHPSIVDFARRALQVRELRLYQAGVSAKFTGMTNYEQPMHTDRNHSFLPPRSEAPWWHLESFLYLSDVEADCAPTHLVPIGDSVGRSPSVPLIMPQQDPEIYAAERPAIGVRGSLLAYRPDVFHRGVDITAPHGSRFLLNASFKGAGQDWIGFDSVQARANSLEWMRFVEGSTPEELSLFGFPPPGHPIWNDAMIDATADRYPALDLTPWRAARQGTEPR